MDEAVRIAAQFPWARTGCVEVRAVRDLGMVRQRVNAATRYRILRRSISSTSSISDMTWEPITSLSRGSLL